MKHILLHTLGDLSYRDVLREVVRRPLDPKSGVGIQEMRESLKVLDALDSADGTLELEDSDYETLKRKVDAMMWNVVDKRIVQLVDEVNAAD